MKTFMTTLLASALLAVLLSPVSASATVYQYTYTNQLPAYFDEAPWNDPIYLSIVITSPTPLLFSSSDQSATPGLSITGSDNRYQTLTYPGPTEDYFACIYFLELSAADAHLPGRWSVSVGNPYGGGCIASTQNLVYDTGLWQSDESIIFGGPISATANSPGTWAFRELPDSVPEPSTLLLFGAGLAGLALLRRR